MTKGRRYRVRTIMTKYGVTYASAAGIELENEPAPLFQLLVLCMLLSSRVRADQAVSSVAALNEAGLTTPEKMAGSTWHERVSAVAWGEHDLYDERTAGILGETAHLIVRDYYGDLRELRERAGGDPELLQDFLTELKGVGPLGAEIFMREVQGIWSEVYPFADQSVLQTSKELRLGETAHELSFLVEQERFAELVAALVRIGLSSRTSPPNYSSLVGPLAVYA